jgi:hypothetical protein
MFVSWIIGIGGGNYFLQNKKQPNVLLAILSFLFAGLMTWGAFNLMSHHGIIPFYLLLILLLVIIVYSFLIKQNKIVISIFSVLFCILVFIIPVNKGRVVYQSKIDNAFKEIKQNNFSSFDSIIYYGDISQNYILGGTLVDSWEGKTFFERFKDFSSKQDTFCNHIKSIKFDKLTYPARIKNELVKILIEYNKDVFYKYKEKLLQRCNLLLIQNTLSDIDYSQKIHKMHTITIIDDSIQEIKGSELFDYMKQVAFFSSKQILKSLDSLKYVLIRKPEEKFIAEYSMGGTGYQMNWHVYVLDLYNEKIVFDQLFFGELPPESYTYRISDQYNQKERHICGTYPQEEYNNWEKSFFKN